MGRTAREASDTFAVREWAAKLASLAGPRDYRGQLEQIYNWIVEHWRYVREPDEWVHGSARSLIGHVLGVKYNAPDEDPRHVRILEMASKVKGWGDCDDVATLVAAAARAIGMTPYFRVTHRDGAHVAARVKTPTGEWVSVDPVGHPYKPFGWKHEADKEELYDLCGRQVREDQEQGMSTLFSGVEAIPSAQCSRPHLCVTYPGDGGGPRSLAVPYRAARMLASGAVIDGTPAVDERGRRYSYNAKRDLWLDDRLMHLPFGGMDGLFSRGKNRRARRRKRIRRKIRKTVDFIKEGRLRNAVGRTLQNPLFTKAAGVAGGLVGAPPQLTEALARGAGKAYTASSAYGRRQQERFRQKYGGDPLHQKTGQLINIASRFAQGGGGGGLMSSVVGGDASNLLSMFSGVDSDESEQKHHGLRVGSRMVERGHLPFILSCNPVLGAQIVAARAKSKQNQSTGMSGIDDCGRYVCMQGGCNFEVAPVSTISGVPGLAMGELDIESSPTPGSWYRIQKGDTLFGVTSKAYGVKPGAKRLKMARWINTAAANRVFIDPSNADKFFPSGRISFRARYASDPEKAIEGASGRSYAVIWIPATKGDEPPPKVVITPPDAPETKAAPKRPIAVVEEPVPVARPNEPLTQGSPTVPATPTKPFFEVANEFPELFPESKNMTLDAPPVTPTKPFFETAGKFPELFPEGKNMTLDTSLPGVPVAVPPPDPSPDEDPPPVDEAATPKESGKPAAPKPKPKPTQRPSPKPESKGSSSTLLILGASVVLGSLLIGKKDRRRR